VIHDMEKDEVLSALFTMIFTIKPSLQETQLLETRTGLGQGILALFEGGLG